MTTCLLLDVTQSIKSIFYHTDKMKILLLATALFACSVLPIVSAGRFVCYFPNWAIDRQGNIFFFFFSFDPVS